MPGQTGQRRIAYLTSQYPAVSHTFILREVEALRDLGLDVRTCSIRRLGAEHARGPAEKRAAADTYYIQAEAGKVRPLLFAQRRLFTDPRRYLSALRLAWRTRTAGLRALAYQMFYFAEATVLADHLRDIGAGHLHSHFAQNSTSVAMLAAELAGLPFSFTLHGPADLDAPKDWHLPVMVARARFVACISHYARSQVMRFAAPEHWHKLKIIHCGVVPQRYRGADGGEDQATGTELLFVGRLGAVKGVRILLDAMDAARREVPDLRLTIIGDGDERPDLERLAGPLGQAVRFTGYQSQEEVATAMSRADILVLPSFAEGVPVVLMEAMASGKPVVCTQVAGMRELVEDGISGYIVAPGDPVPLAARIVELAGDPALRARMGQAGRAKVEAEFDAREESARLSGLFAGALPDVIRPDRPAGSAAPATGEIPAR